MSTKIALALLGASIATRQIDSLWMQAPCHSFNFLSFSGSAESSATAPSIYSDEHFWPQSMPFDVTLPCPDTLTVNLYHGGGPLKIAVTFFSLTIVKMHWSLAPVQSISHPENVAPSSG